MKKYTRSDIGSPDAPGWFPSEKGEYPVRGRCTRKAIDLLSEIKEPDVRQRAIEICHWPDRPCSSIAQALRSSTKLWCHTREGELYWRRVHNQYAGTCWQIKGIYDSDPIDREHMDLSQTLPHKMPRR